MREPIYHKGNYKKKIEKYAGFGQYEKIPSPLCNKKASPWGKRRQYYMVRNWAQVTCKVCLKRKENESN